MPSRRRTFNEFGVRAKEHSTAHRRYWCALGAAAPSALAAASRQRMGGYLGGIMEAVAARLMALVEGRADNGQGRPNQNLPASPAARLAWASRYMPDPKPDDVDFHEETDSPIYVDDRGFYKVEKWTRDGTKVDSLLNAGNSLGMARAVFECYINGGSRSAEHDDEAPPLPTAGDRRAGSA
jgi:hypothetical protein